MNCLKFQIRTNGNDSRLPKRSQIISHTAGTFPLQEVTGNTDRDTAVYHELKPPITARYIRLQPVAWHRHISMRIEFSGCEDDVIHM